MTRHNSIDGNGQTPPAGTPILTPEDIDTGRHSMAMSETLSGASALPGVEPEDVLEVLAKKVAEKVGGGGPPHRKFLGLEFGAWTKLILGWSIAAGIFLITWYNTVNANMKERPTRAEIVDTLGVHSAVLHPGAVGKEDLRAVDKRVQLIEIEQRAQGVQLQNIGQGIKEIRGDVKHLRER